MKFLTALLSLLLITYTYQETVALSECEVENDSTTKSTAKITCSSDKDINNVAFVDNYLKLNGNAAGNATSKTATLGTCTAACTGNEAPFACTISCQKVTVADAGAYYVLTKIEKAAESGVFSTTGKTSDGVTIANKDNSQKVYEGQAAASNNGANTNNSNSSNKGDSDDSCSFIKYHFIGLMCLLLF